MHKSGLALGTALAMLFAVTPSLAETTAAEEIEEIVVYGTGQTRQIQSITSAAIELLAPGSSPLKAIEKLPGVSFQHADPFGSYEWSSRISIRSFNQNQLGFTLDGVPLGDMSYGNSNGLHISRAIISENVGRVDVAQGAGALGTASSSNLGGTIQFRSKDPSDVPAADASLTGGSNNFMRGYVRLETGKFSTGGKAYISYAQSDTDKWKGWGDQKQKQFNLKAVQPIGAGKVTVFVDWSDRKENDYQDMSLEMIRGLGYKWDNISNNWPLAIQLGDIGNNNGDSGTGIITNPAAGKVYPGKIISLDDAYYGAAGLRKDTVGAISLDYPITDALQVKGTVYGHGNKGQGSWYTPYVPSSATIPVSFRTTEYEIERYGFTGGLTYDIANHIVEAGTWLETNNFDHTRNYYAVASRTDPGGNALQFQNPSNLLFTDWHYKFNTDTYMFYLSDTWKVMDALTVNAGFKSLKAIGTVDTILARVTSGAKSRLLSGSITTEDNFLPQAGVRYELAPGQELFAGYAKNMRAFQISGAEGLFGAVAPSIDKIRSKLNPEESRTIEAGWRFRFGSVQGSLVGYDVSFSNRLFGIPAGPAIQGNPAVIQNVGGVTTRGAELGATWEVMRNVSLYGSYTYNYSSYDDDVKDETGLVLIATKDKLAVNTPRHMLKGELSYDDGSLFGNLSVDYVGRRYVTYLNDTSVPDYGLVNLSFGYRVKEGGAWLKGLEIQGNVTNLLDTRYISTAGTNGFAVKGDNQTLLPGAPRQFFVTLKKSF